jgi:ABC-type branched-subunit amino acid transport system ATPase component
LALATFGFGILLQQMFYTQPFMFGSNGIGVTVPRPHLSWLNVAGDKGYYYVVLVLAIVAGAFVVTLNRTRLGRLLRGAADSRTALETSGTTVTVTRVMVFCISSFMAAIGGALAASARGTVIADSYQPILSLTYFALIMVVVGGEPWNAILGSAALILVPSYMSGSKVSVVIQLVFGAAAIAYAVLPGSVRGVPAPVTRLIDSTFGRVRIAPPGRRRPKRGPRATPRRAAALGGLTVDGLKVRFGGLVAVDGVSIKARGGKITGLIGPNGAGKTTTFNACSGLLRPSSGRILLDEVDVTRRGPAARARLGLGRTFQRMELFDSLTVRENVEAGAEATLAGANPLTQVAGRPGDRATVRVAAESALRLCELRELSEVPAASLSTGQRRLVELARCLAGPFGLLLLDEPSSGLDRAETEHFGQILKRVVADRGIGVLIVEHDMALVLDVCEHVYVLDFGELIFEGTPAEVISSPIVRAAYLGDTAVEHAVALEHQVEDVS